MTRRAISVSLFAITLVIAAAVVLPKVLHFIFVMISAVKDERASNLACTFEKGLSIESQKEGIFATEVEVECYENPSDVLYPSKKEFALYLSSRELQISADGPSVSAELIMRSRGRIQFWMVAGVLHCKVEASELIWYSKKPKLIDLDTEIVR